MIKKIIKNPLTYPIFVDIIIITLAVVIGFILSETFLPGIVSAYISSFTLFAIIYTLLVVTIFIAHKQAIFFTTKKRSLPLLLFGTLIFGILIVIASFRFDIILNIISTIFCIIIFVLLYTIFREKIS